MIQRATATKTHTRKKSRRKLSVVIKKKGTSVSERIMVC